MLPLLAQEPWIFTMPVRLLRHRGLVASHFTATIPLSSRKVARSPRARTRRGLLPMLVVARELICSTTRSKLLGTHEHHHAGKPRRCPEFVRPTRQAQGCDSRGRAGCTGHPQMARYHRSHGMRWSKLPTSIASFRSFFRELVSVSRTVAIDFAPRRSAHEPSTCRLWRLPHKPHG